MQGKRLLLWSIKMFLWIQENPKVHQGLWRIGWFTLAEMAKKTHLLKLILTSLLLGADNGINATELMGQWYMTSSGDRLITYYGPKEECEVYGSLEAVNQTMEAVRGM